MLTIGDKAPKEVTKDANGKWTVVYFYPKDDTLGCAKEACSIRDNFTEITGLGARVIGISKDGLASHDKFREKYSLPFDLVPDADHKLIDAFGVTGRSTFLIDPSGKIVHVWKKVVPDSHGREIADVLKSKIK